MSRNKQSMAAPRTQKLQVILFKLSSLPSVLLSPSQRENSWERRPCCSVSETVWDGNLATVQVCTWRVCHRAWTVSEQSVTKITIKTSFLWRQIWLRCYHPVTFVPARRYRSSFKFGCADQSFLFSRTISKVSEVWNCSFAVNRNAPTASTI